MIDEKPAYAGFFVCADASIQMNRVFGHGRLRNR